MRTLLAVPAIAFAATAQVPAPEPETLDRQPVRVLVGGPAELRARLVELVRLEVGPAVQVVAADSPAMTTDTSRPTVLFAAEELLLRRLVLDGGLDPLLAGNDLTGGFRDPEGRYAVTLLSPITLAFDTRAFTEVSAPASWDELPFATSGEERVAAIDPALDPVPMAAWIAMQIEQGHGEDRAFGWLAALDARVHRYSTSQEALLDELRSGRASLAPLPLLMVHRAIADGLRIGHRLPREGLPARGLGLALRAGGADSDQAVEVAGKLAAAGFTRRCSVATGLLAALRAEDPQRPAADIELLGRLVRPPGPETVDRWLRRFETDVRGRGAALEHVDTVLELVFGLLFAGFLFFVYLRIRRTDAREPAS